jgi:hypothetical protein
MCFAGSQHRSVAVNFSGGTSPYTVRFNGGAYTTEPGVVYSGGSKYTQLDSKMPMVLNGCTASGLQTITQPAAAVTTSGNYTVCFATEPKHRKCYGNSWWNISHTR